MKKNWILLIILAIGFFLRFYRTTDLLGFYFDQGRDAKVIWELWHNHKFFLIGPTTGIEGIFLGPAFYYLIAPAYLIGNGNPLFPALELIVINILGIYVIYRIGKDYFGEKAGLIAAFLIAISNRFVQDHRWLSDPTPLPLSAALSVFLLLKIINQQAKYYHYLLLGFFLGISLQFEAASATFFLPATFLIFIIFYRPIFRQFRNLLHLSVTFVLTLIPQLYFNFRHENISFQAFYRFLISEKSFQTVLPSFYSDRLKFYYQVFMEKLINNNNLLPIFSILILFILIFSIRYLINKDFGLLAIWVLVPLVSLLFYHGNYGYVWGYYFTGIYPIFILLIAILLSRVSKAILVLFMFIFVFDNTIALKNFLSAGLEGPYSITLGNSLAAVDWVYEDTKDTKFNVDVYVPPVISHSYDYLFLWRGNTKFKTLPTLTLTSRLYTLYEQDPPHPERLNTWLTRQAGYAEVVSETRFGGVTAQKRTRYP